MRIAVCGCSLSAKPDDYHRQLRPQFVGTHFSSILERKGHTVLNLAKTGVSNSHIRLQIQEVAAWNPDVVIYTPTNGPRIEIFRGPYDQSLLTKSLGNIADMDKNEGHTGYSIHAISSVSKLSKDKSKIMKTWLKYFGDEKWASQQDEWIIRDALNFLAYKKIPVIFQPGYFMGQHNAEWDYEDYNVKNMFYNFDSILVEKKDSLSYLSELNRSWIEEDPGYHTTPKMQARFAQILEEKYLTRINTI